MRNRTMVIWGLVALFTLLLLGVVAAQVGGIAVRNNVTRTDQLTMSISQPVVRGVETTVRWEGVQASGRQIDIYFRDARGEHILAEVEGAAGVARVEFDCESLSDRVSVVLRDRADGAVLANQAVDLLPPGPECAF